MITFRSCKTAQGGFSLTELSVALAIIAMVAGSAISVLITGDYTAKRSQTDSKQERIRDALASFLATAHRLPCPADPTLRTDNDAFGKEIVAAAFDPALPAACDDGSGTLGYNSTAHVYVGAVPVTTLGLPDDYISDGWGNRFLFVIDGDFAVSETQNLNCSASSEPPSGPCFILNTDPDANISIIGEGGVLKTAAAVYALISFGENGHGAWTGYGAEERIQAYTEDTPYKLAGSDELKNAKLDDAGTDAFKTPSFTPEFVQKSLVDKREEPDDAKREYFDDVVLFRTKTQMIADADVSDTEPEAPSPKLFNAACLYAEEALADPVHNRCTGAKDYDACQKFAAELKERCL